jgi:hypothetical protein
LQAWFETLLYIFLPPFPIAYIFSNIYNCKSYCFLLMLIKYCRSYLNFTSLSHSFLFLFQEPIQDHPSAYFLSIQNIRKKSSLSFLTLLCVGVCGCRCVYSWGLNPGPDVCSANTQPLSYTPAATLSLKECRQVILWNDPQYLIFPHDSI